MVVWVSLEWTDTMAQLSNSQWFVVLRRGLRKLDVDSSMQLAGFFCSEQRLVCMVVWVCWE
jgi:hypothetical protein